MAQAGANFADANRVLTEQILFEQLQALRAARDGEDVAIDAGALHDWILSASRLAQTSQREQALQAKLRELEAKEEERRAAAEKLKAAAERAKGAGGITEETMRDIERQVRML